MQPDEHNKLTRFNGQWFLLMLVGVAAVWLVGLAVLTADVYLDVDSTNMAVGILDRANRPGEAEHLEIYGVPGAPLSVRLLSWMAAYLPRGTLVVATNIITMPAWLVTLVCVYITYRREFSPQRLVLTLAMVSLPPVYGFYGVTFHPYI